jgi:hypothetical protein
MAKQLAATRMGHLVWKRHPLGGLIGLGTSPFGMIGLRAAPGSGIAERMSTE